MIADHDPVFMMLSLAVCVAGSILSMRLFARVRRTSGTIKHLWLFLSGLIAGGTVWSTHFLAMLGFEGAMVAGYEPVASAMSLLVAFAATTAGFLLAASTQRSPMIEIGGAILGAGIAAMHYIGVSATEMLARIEWHQGYFIVSIIIAAFFGMIATNRIARPVTRFCKYGGALSLILATVVTHSIGMAAMEIKPDSDALISGTAVSGSLLAIGIIAVMSTLLAVAFAAYTIDHQSSRQAKEHYRYLALHDPLTGLPNRTQIEKHLDRLVERNEDDTARCAIVVLDLDRFKEVNDVHGHAAGDALLRSFAERVTDSLEDDEFVGRFGGDEFLAIKSSIFKRGDGRAFAEKLHGIANGVFEWDGNALEVGASVGVALYPDDGSKSSQLMEQADLAMYRAKSLGKNQIAVYDATMDEESRERSVLAVDLRCAVKNGELEVHYQRQNDVVSREVTGFEALLRWNHPDRGMISPAVFIPIAEETGLIVEIGEWVLRTACAEAASWERPLSIAVNVASAQLTLTTLPKTVHEVLLSTGLSPSRLELEITESGIIHDQTHALQIIRQLKTLGVSIAMDDYGTGYSSLSTLQNFPFDKIKVDREFVKDVPESRQSAAIIRATIILGSSLDIPVLAEGVETEEHLAFLQEAGCASIQGFFFGRPMPVAEVREIAGVATAKQPESRRNQTVADERRRKAA